MVGYSSITMLYMEKAIIGKNLNVQEHLRPLLQQLAEKANAIMVAKDDLQAQETKLSVQKAGISEMTAIIAHREAEIASLSKKMRKILPELNEEDQDLADGFTALCWTVAALSSENDRAVERKKALITRTDARQQRYEHLRKQHAQMGHEGMQMVSDWQRIAYEASALGDDSAMEEGKQYADAYVAALTAEKDEVF